MDSDREEIERLIAQVALGDRAAFQRNRNHVAPGDGVSLTDCIGDNQGFPQPNPYLAFAISNHHKGVEA